MRHAEYFVDPALGFAYGWNIVYLSCVACPAEIVAGAVLFQFWTNINPAIFITLLGLAIYASNMVSVRWYGETEFIFSMMKLCLISGLILMGVCIDLGGSPSGEVIGFKYWTNPGPFAEYLLHGSAGKIAGLWSVFVDAAYSYSGVEAVGVCAAEAKNAYSTIPKATKRVFFRVLLCYLAAIFVVGLIVPSTSVDLLNYSGTASQSPFVIAANIAGIRILPSIINAIIVTSAWSRYAQVCVKRSTNVNSGNHSAFSGSRVLYGLALDKKAPQIFAKVNRRGVPYVAVSFVCIWMLLGYMTLGGTSATTVFNYLQDLCAASSLSSWMIICWTSIRLQQGLRRQKISRNDLPWSAFGQPYIGWIGFIGATIILIAGGFNNFISVDGASNFVVESFVSSYVNMLFLAVMFFGWKIAKRTKAISLEAMPIMYFIDKYKSSSSDSDPSLVFHAAPRTIMEKLGALLWG